MLVGTRAVFVFILLDPRRSGAVLELVVEKNGARRCEGIPGPRSGD